MTIKINNENYDIFFDTKRIEKIDLGSTVFLDKIDKEEPDWSYTGDLEADGITCTQADNAEITYNYKTYKGVDAVKFAYTPEQKSNSFPVRLSAYTSITLEFKKPVKVKNRWGMYINRSIYGKGTMSMYLNDKSVHYDGTFFNASAPKNIPTDIVFDKINFNYYDTNGSFDLFSGISLTYKV